MRRSSSRDRAAARSASSMRRSASITSTLTFRSGLYPSPTPFTLGNEAAGVVTAVGRGVTGFKTGDRVAYVAGLRSYAEEANVPAEVAVKLPKGISFETAAAMMLKGMTAEYLLRRTYKVRKGDTILVHAAAGGVGLILCQWGKGARRDGDRHGGLAGEGRARQEERRSPHHPLPRGGFREAGRRDHQGQEVPGRL